MRRCCANQTLLSSRRVTAVAAEELSAVLITPIRVTPALGAGLDVDACCHMFRATRITTYIENFGLLENDQRMASHEYPRTTKLHDRTSDAVTVEKIVI